MMMRSASFNGLSLERKSAGERTVRIPGNIWTLKTVASIASIFRNQGRFPEAILRCKRALGGFRDTCGTEDSRARLVEHEIRALLLHLYRLCA
jgi:hypothetical protein